MKDATAGGGLTLGRAILYGTLALGVLDLLDALIFFGLRGVAPILIPQSIASGVLGGAAAADRFRRVNLPATGLVP